MATAVSVDSGKDQSPVQVGANDLPLHCPGPRAPLWSLHPRVFLDVTKTGSVRCPYCGTLNMHQPGKLLCCDLLRKAVIAVLVADRLENTLKAAERHGNN